MFVAPLPGFAEADPVDDGGVVEFVRENGVFRRGQHLEETRIRVEARRVQNRVFLPVESRDFRFQLLIIEMKMKVRVSVGGREWEGLREEEEEEEREIEGEIEREREIERDRERER